MYFDLVEFQNQCIKLPLRGQQLKISAALSKGLNLIPSIHMDSSQPLITPFLGD